MHNRGNAAIEYALVLALPLLAGALLSSFPSFFGRGAAVAEGTVAGSGGAPAVAVAAREDGCLSYGDGDDVVTSPQPVPCHALGLGADEFHGGSLDLDLFVTGSAENALPGIIETGAGNDRIRSTQAGTVASGPGDDLVEIDLTGLGGGAGFALDLGPGHDQARVLAPNSRYPGILVPGPGESRVDADCGGKSLLLGASNASRLDFSGPCVIEIFQEGLHDFAAALDGLSGIRARLEGGHDVALNVVTAAEAAAPVEVVLAAISGLRFEADITTQSASFLSIEDIPRFPKSIVRARLTSPGGTVRLAGALHPTWNVVVDHTDAGAASRIVLAPGEDSLGLPALSGHVRELVLQGCFDAVTVTDSRGRHSVMPCPETANLRTDLHRAGSLEIRLGGRNLRTSLSGLEVDRLVVVPASATAASPGAASPDF